MPHYNYPSSVVGIQLPRMKFPLVNGILQWWELNKPAPQILFIVGLKGL